MYLRIAENRRPVTNSLHQFGMTNGSEATVSLIEFTYAKGKEIYGENETAEWVYQIKAGAVRTYKLTFDGRRQIGAFHLMGDIFGMENGPLHRFTAEAIVETTVYLIRRRSLEAIAENDPIATGDLLKLTSVSLERAENHVLLLGRNTALERVAAFLVEMDKRLTAAGIMTLPMSRLDIADYLGLTIETVSRVFSYLHDAGVVDLCGTFNREIVVRDRLRLSSFDLPL